MMHSAKRFGSLLGLGLLLSAGACSDSDDDGDRPGVSVKTEEGNTTVAVDPAMAQAALNELTASVDVTISDFEGATTPAAPPRGAAASGGIPPAAPPAEPGVGSAATQGGVTINCTAGGNANVGGFVSIVPEPIAVDVNAMIAYNGCVTRSGTTLDGSLEFSQSVVVGGAPGLRVETVYTGDVELKGAVNARCPVDLNVLVDETGRAVQVDGTFCGQDASKLNLQIMPRWSIKAQHS